MERRSPLASSADGPVPQPSAQFVFQQAQKFLVLSNLNKAADQRVDIFDAGTSGEVLQSLSPARQKDRFDTRQCLPKPQSRAKTNGSDPPPIRNSGQEPETIAP